MSDNKQNIVISVGVVIIVAIIMFNLIFSQVGNQTQGCYVSTTQALTNVTAPLDSLNLTNVYSTNAGLLTATLTNAAGTTLVNGTNYALSYTLGTYTMINATYSSNVTLASPLTIDYRYQCTDYLTNSQTRSIAGKIPTILIAVVVMLGIAAILIIVGRNK